MKKRMIILDGPDGLGKTTQAKLMNDYLLGKYVYQPSAENTVGFIRKIVKEDPDIPTFPRQLLHTVSHLVDAYEEIGNQDLVFDRCFTSAWVYGNLLRDKGDLTQDQLDLLIKTNSTVYRKQLEKHDYQVDVIILTGKRRFGQADNSYYEKQLAWDNIREYYLKVYNLLKEQGAAGNPWFSKNERVHLYDVDLSKPVEVIHSELVSLLENGQ